MNSYLAEFLTLGLDKHFTILYRFFFGVSGSIIMVYIIRIVNLLLFIALPWVIVRVIRDFEEDHPKWTIVLDIISIIALILVGLNIFPFYSGMQQAISSTGGFYGSAFRGLLDYRINIGRLCGVLYGVLLSSRLFNKYFVKLKIERYKKPIFTALFVVWVFILYYFYYLCQFLSA